eukprot:gene10152-11189_t
MKENNGENTVAKYAQHVAFKTEKIRELIGEQILPFVACGTSLKSTLVSSKDSDVGILGNLLSDIAEAMQDTATSPIVSSGAVALIAEKLNIHPAEKQHADVEDALYVRLLTRPDEEGNSLSAANAQIKAAELKYCRK